MDMKDPKIAQGMGMITIGITLMIVLDPFILGLPFIAIGIQRLASPKDSDTAGEGDATDS